MADNPFETLNNIYTKQVEENDKKGYADLFKKVTNFFFEDINDDEDTVNFTFTDIKYLDGYYIFGFGTNSVIHFHIKECPGWKFGIWWHEPKDNIKVPGEWFAQFEETIDKFKPSHSTFIREFTIENKDNINDRYCYDVWDIRKDIEFIMNEPYLAFCRDYCSYNYNQTYLSREEAKQVYDEWRERTNKEKALTTKWDSKILKWVENNILPNYINAEIKDMGEYRFPRYDVFVPFAENSDIVDEPGWYSWYSEEETEEDIKLSKEFDVLMEAAQKEFKEIESYYFSPIHQSVIFYNKEEEENG